MIKFIDFFFIIVKGVFKKDEVLKFLIYFNYYVLYNFIVSKRGKYKKFLSEKNISIKLELYLVLVNKVEIFFN